MGGGLTTSYISFFKALALTLVILDDGPLVALLPEHDVAHVQDGGHDLEDVALLLLAHVHRRHCLHHLGVVRAVIRVLHLRRRVMKIISEILVFTNTLVFYIFLGLYRVGVKDNTSWGPREYLIEISPIIKDTAISSTCNLS